MGFVRATLARRREDLFDEPDRGGAGRDPSDAEPPHERADPAVPAQPGPEPVPGEPPAGGGDTTDAGPLVWSPEAERRLEHVPSFVRPMARLGIEQFAREKGYREITAAVMDEMRGRLGG
ncbi:MAG: PCP reductase family protein [Deltaproteobacteria bacterium]|nr:PCP reductase family protein [Deltaproteobacteria bacterium]MBI3077186.1 PCP reductase family protein [Deltaproteobacteria bacterium]